MFVEIQNSDPCNKGGKIQNNMKGKKLSKAKATKMSLSLTLKEIYISIYTQHQNMYKKT